MGDYDVRSAYRKYVKPCLLVGAATFATVYGTLLLVEPSYEQGSGDNHLTVNEDERAIDRYFRRLKRQWPKHIKPFLENIVGDL